MQADRGGRIRVLPITGLYAGLMALIAVALGILVGVQRARTGISILHGQDMNLATAIRRHGNFTEVVPLALILLAALELNGASPGLLHGLGIALVVARIAHPLGLKHDNMRNPLRGIGAGGTTLITVIAAVALIWGYLSR
jgi:uncharacterized membrane protein YecN with MAPEG domain